MITARLTVVTANIGRGVGPSEAAANIARVVNGFKRTAWRRNDAMIDWQEIDEADHPDEHGILHRTLRVLTPGAALTGFRTACPIAVPIGWNVIRERVDQTCEGKPHATPHRVAVQALLEHAETGLRFVAINGHYPLPRLAGWPLWERCDDAWRLIVEHWNEQGYTVIATRDRNSRGNMDPLSPFARELLPASGIDKITVVQAIGPHAVRVIAGKPRTVDLTIDGHDAHGVPLTFTPLDR